MARVELRGVSFKYQATRSFLKSSEDKLEESKSDYAIENLDLVVEDGEIVVLLGPSGCGKTTVLRLIAGLDSPQLGEVCYDGHPVNDVPAKDRGIGIVFQNYALYPHRKGRGNLSFFFELRKREDEVDERVKFVADVLGVDFIDLMGRKPKQLSGGQQQRVAIGRCIVRNPAIILMDEPLSNLDAKLRGRSRVEIKKLLKKFKVTSVYVTHDQTEAAMMADRVYVMNGGHIVQDGSFADLRNHPNNLFVAGFIGTTPMNLIEGEVDLDKKSIRTPRFEFPLPVDWIDRVYNHPEVVVGIRPEDFLPAEEVSKEWIVSGKVLLAEPFPGEGKLHVYFMPLEGMEGRVVGGDFIVCTDMSRILPKGDPIEVGLDRDKIHLFDSKTGEVVV